MIDIPLEQRTFETEYAKGRKIFKTTFKKFADGTYYNLSVREAWKFWLAAKTQVISQLEGIYDIFHVGSNARSINTLRVNCENAARRSSCLGRIENTMTQTLISDEPESYGEKYDESLLNWGESPDDYEKRFQSIWEPREELFSKIKSGEYTLVTTEQSKDKEAKADTEES